MFPTPRRWTNALLALALVFAACGEEPGRTGKPAAGPAPSPAPAPAPRDSQDAEIAALVAKLAASQRAMDGLAQSEVVAASFRIGLALAPARPLYPWQPGARAEQAPPAGSTHHLTLYVRERLSRRHVPGSTVRAKLVGADGQIRWELALAETWDRYPFYGATVKLEPGRLAVVVAPPAYDCHAEMKEVHRASGEAAFEIEKHGDGLRVRRGPAPAEEPGYTQGSDLAKAASEFKGRSVHGDWLVGFIVEGPEPFWLWREGKLVSRPVAAEETNHLEIVLVDRTTGLMVTGAGVRLRLVAQGGAAQEVALHPLAAEFYHYGQTCRVEPGEYQVEASIEPPRVILCRPDRFPAPFRATFSWSRAAKKTAQASPAPSAAPGKTGVILMAHGGDPAWNQEVERLAASLRPRHDVEIAFGMAECHTLQTAAARLEARGATTLRVVRLFVRSESFRERIQYLLGLRSDPPGGQAPRPDCCVPSPKHDACRPLRTRARVELAGALDGHALLGPILAERAAALSRDPAREAVLLLSHGLGDDAANARLVADMERLAAEVRRVRPFGLVAAETLREDWPDKRQAAEARLAAFRERAARQGLAILVVPYRVVGFGPYAEVLKGWTYRADGRGFLPHANVARWVEEQIRPSAS